LPIDERLRTVAKGQFSRLAQYEIEVENPLRPKEIQDRIRAGETADEIADAAGIPPDRVRRFEGPVLAERQYRAQEAQRATIRGRGDSGPGPRLGDIVAERLSGVGAHPDNAEWDSRKRPDGNWQVQVQFTIGGRASTAEWIYDPRRRHVIPDDDQAVRLCLPPEEWAAVSFAERGHATATVTPIASRQHSPYADQTREYERRAAVPPRPRDADFAVAGDANTGRSVSSGPTGSAAAHGGSGSATADAPATGASSDGETSEARGPAKKAASGRSRRASVPSWDEIMFGTSRQPD
jgi:hypothetical protein